MSLITPWTTAILHLHRAVQFHDFEINFVDTQYPTELTSHMGMQVIFNLFAANMIVLDCQTSLTSSPIKSLFSGCNW